MALSQPFGVFGIHSLTCFKLDTNEVYGTVRVTGSASLSLSGETIDLVGGSNRYPWDSEVGMITSEMSLVFREYPAWIYEVFLGSKATSLTEKLTSTIENIKDINGSIILDGEVTDIVPLAGSEENLKFGDYTLVAKDATTAELFISTDIDLNRGTPTIIIDDSLAIAKDIDLSASVDLTDWGIQILGAATAMTPGHTLSFSVSTPRKDGVDVKIGSSSDSFPNFGAYALANKRGDNGFFKITAYNCKAAGVPIGMTEKEWSTSEITVKLNYSAKENAVFRVESQR